METYLKVLDIDDSSAGGGSASAIAGAMAGALMAMVAKLSAPPAGTPEDAGTSLFAGIAGRGKALSDRLRQGALEDTQSFQSVRDAYKLPKATDAEKTARQAAVQTAWKAAAQTPLDNAERCLAVLDLGVEMLGKTNPNVYSDYSTGLYLARAGLLGCLDNVAINLPSIKDAEFAARLSAAAAGIRSRAEEAAARLALPRP